MNLFNERDWEHQGSFGFPFFFVGTGIKGLETTTDTQGLTICQV